MDQLDTLRIAEALKSAPIWARLALTAQKESLVERAAETMAALIAHKLGQGEPADERLPRLPIP